MPKPDRTIAPEFKSIDKFEIIKATESKLSNGIPVYTINAGQQDIVKIDLIFDAGSWYQDANLIASSANALINEGTTNYTNAQIAEKLDYYGSFLNLEAGKHTATITLYALHKYLPESLVILEDIVKNANYPQKEFNTYIKKRKQRYIIDTKKVDKVAKAKFFQTIFGENHPYGKVATLSCYENIKREWLQNFFNNFYTSNRCKIILAGKILNNHHDLLEKHFGKINWKQNKNQTIPTYNFEPAKEFKFYENRPEAVQSAIRIGKMMLNKLHPDYIGMQVVNMVLGGYFGSRLMSNIREDKGYTYGIGSSVVSMKNSGFFNISSEVGKDVWQDAVKEIYTEIRILREELVEEEELNLVRNYLLGEILRVFDGPFELSNTFRGILDYDLGYDYYDNFIHTVKTITPQEINRLANLYLQENSLYEIVTG